MSSDNTYFAERFLDILSELPENIGNRDYHLPIVFKDGEELSFSADLLSHLDKDENSDLKAWATFENVKNLF